MVKRKPSLVQDCTTTDDERSFKGGFFANWFSHPARTETREETDFSGDSVGSDSIDDQYPSGSRRGRKNLPDSFRSDTDFDTADEDSLVEFDRELRVRHGQACKYMRTGKFAKALKKFEGILASILERFGETHHRVGAALHNVGIANLRAGKLADAMDAIEEAVRIRKATLGADDSKVADSLVELGIVLLSLKEHSESLEIFMEALEIREAEADDALLPEEIKETNLKVAKVLNNIGCVNFENGKFETAKDAFVDAIKLQKKTLGEPSSYAFANPVVKPGFLTMASTMCNKAYVDLEQGNYTFAISTLNESLAIQKVLLGADNKLVLSTLDNLGFAYAMNCSYEKSLATLMELHSSQEKSYSETQVACAKTLQKIVFVELKRADYEGALKSLCALEDLQLEYEGTDPNELAMTQKLMGQVNYQVLKYPTAGCSIFSCSSESDDSVDLSDWIPKKPANGSKMSGHRVTCA